MSQYLTVRAISERWGVSKSAVYAMIADGLLPSIRLGTGRGTIRVKVEVVEAFERDRTREDAKEIAEHFGG